MSHASRSFDEMSPSSHSDQTSHPHTGASSSGSGRKRLRGRASGQRVTGLEAGEKFTVEFDDRHRAVGDNHPKFVSQQGVIVRNMLITPVGAPSWRRVEKEKKSLMVENVKEKFDMGDEPEREKLLLRSLGKKWRDFRYKLKKEFYDTRATDEQRLENPPPMVSAEDWNWLVTQYWGKSKVQEMCEKNKENREVQQMLHRTGRKSFASIEHEETKKTGVRPSRIQMFERCYTKKDGSFADDFARQKAEEIHHLIADREEGSSSLGDEDIFTQVFGPDRPGRMRCRGYGVTPSSESGISRSGSSKATQEARRDAEIARKEAEAARKELEEYKIVADERAKKMEDNMATVMQALQRLTGGSNCCN